MNFSYTFALLCSALAIVSAGDVWITKAPSGFEVDKKFSMKQNDIASFLFRVFGVTESADCSWPGLVQSNPFSVSKRAVIVAVPSSTADEDQVDFPGTKLLLASPFSPQGIEYALDHPLTVVFGRKAGAEVVDHATIPVSKNFRLPTNTLNASSTQVSHFIDQLSALASLVSVVEASNAPPKAYLFEFDSLDALGKKEDIAEARRLIGAVLRGLSDEFDGSVLTVSYSPVKKTRTKRQATAAEMGDDENNYVVPLNLILWLSLALFFITLAVCIGIASMDPGWDSIIYRMTSQRMKKDN